MKHVLKRLAGGRGLRPLPLLVLLVLALPGPARELRVEDAGVSKRMALMNTAKFSLGALADMMAGRVMFDAGQATTARRVLVRATRAIPARFRRPHSDPLSHARPEIWAHWDDFKTRARAANRAARGLNTRSLNGLRKTLPDLMQRCLACHEVYRSPRRPP